METKASKAFVLFVRFPLWALLAATIVMGISSRRGYRDLSRMNARNAELTHQIADLKTQKSQLEFKVHSLRTDSLYQEYVIRERLGYVHSHEKVIQFD